MKSLVFFFACFFLGLPAASFASSDYAPSGALKVFWTCQFDATTETATQLSCSDLEHYFFDANSQEASETMNPATADLKIDITEQTRPGNLRRYYISLIASDQFETPPITLPWLDIDDAVPVQNRRTALQNRILSGVRLYQTTLTQGNAPTTPLESESTPFYFDAGASGSGRASGQVKSANIVATASASYFPKNERFRFDVTGSGYWVSQSLPGEKAAIRGELFVPDVSVTGLYSFDAHKKWSVAIITDHSAAAGANIKASHSYETGVEYILVPFLTNQPHQISIRSGSAWNQIELVKPNSLNHLQENMVSAFAQIIYINEFLKGKMNLTANAKVMAFPGLQNFNQYSGGAIVSYRLSRRVVLNATANYQQMKKSLTYPSTLDYKNPAQLLFLGSAPGKTYSYTFGAKITLGRTSKRTNDRRWAN